MATENKYLNHAQHPEYSILMGLYPSTTPVMKPPKVLTSGKYAIGLIVAVPVARAG
jgi:hypothetical protein